MEFYIAALLIVVGVALYVAAPLTGGLAGRTRKSRDDLDIEHWEHEDALAVQGLRELEFDREMKKLSDADYASLRAALETRALEAMTAIERVKERQRAANLAAVAAPRRRPQPGAAAPEPGGVLPLAPPAAAPSPGAARWWRARFCPQCGMRVSASGSFCADCGAAVRPGGRLASQA